MTPTICLLASGTLGDVAPFVALGCGLRATGASVRVVTHARFRPLVLAHGLAFADLGPNPGDLLDAAPDALTLEGGPLAAVRASLGYVRRARPVYARMLTAALTACRGADILLVALPTLWGADIAEALDIPIIVAPLQPLTPTGAWPSALLPRTRSYSSRMPLAFGPRGNRLSHRLLGFAVWLPWRPVFDAWRTKELRLAPARTDHLTRLLVARTRFVYGYSPWLVQRPPDWPGHHTLAGAWHIPESEYEPPRELAAFLAAGPPPAYIGFGSMGVRQPSDDAALVLGAARQAGRRVVLLGGTEARALAAECDDVFVTEHVPHDWLLPRVAAAIHHGGAGTTHAALRAGLPSAAVPVAADQYFWGERVAALGAALPPVPRGALDAQRLAQLLWELDETAQVRRRAVALGQLLGAEDGVARAVEAIRAAAG